MSLQTRIGVLELLSRRLRQRERLHAMGLSVHLFVCLSICRQNTKTQFSQKLSKIFFRAMVSIDDMGFSVDL